MGGAGAAIALPSNCGNLGRNYRNFTSSGQNRAEQRSRWKHRSRLEGIYFFHPEAISKEEAMKARTLIQAVTLCLIASLTALAQQQLQKTDDDDGHHKFQVSSTTFTDGGTLPLITVFNQCPQYPGGGDQSPELSWTKAPEDTRSFMVITYDVTASFTHWGMYNI